MQLCVVVAVSMQIPLNEDFVHNSKGFLFVCRLPREETLLVLPRVQADGRPSRPKLLVS
jgi:hypothetical protein